MSRILRIFLLIVLLATPVTGLAKPAPINDVYAIHFILDGANYKRVWQVIDAGLMPTLKNLFIDNGAVFTKAISTFPSTSTSAYQSFISGLLPGHAGIPHLQRFDRQKEEFIDYLSVKGYLMSNTDLINLNALQNAAVTDLDATNTIFELLDGHPTMAIYTTARRGAAESVPKTLPARGLWAAGVSHDYLRIDQLAFKKLFKKYGGEVRDIPRYSLVGLYSADVAAHKEGLNSKNVLLALRQFDYFLRDFVALLERQGIRDKTYIIVSADHGIHDTGNLFLFRDALVDADIAVKSRDPRYKNFNVVAADRGISSTHVYTRRNDGTFAPLENVQELATFARKDGTPVNLIELIRNMEPMQLVAARDGEDRVLITSANGGAGSIRCMRLNAETWCSYEVLTKPDPLAIRSRAAKRLMGGTPHSSQEWKHAMADEYCTDAVVQLGTIFQDGRAGDVYVIPQNQWGLRDVKEATHGSIIREDMHIPMFIAGPNVPRGTYDAMRTMDIYPLMLEWFGFDIPVGNYDGADPFERYKGEDRLWQRLATIEQNCSSGTCVRRMAGLKRRALKPLAEMELEDRTLLATRLRDYMTALEAQRADKRAPQVAAPEYVEDHLAIAQRIAKLTQRRKEQMQMIVSNL